MEAAPLRAAPTDASEQMSEVLHGEPLIVKYSYGAWTLVRTAYSYDGWIRTSAIEPAAGAFPTANGLSPLESALSYLGASYEWGGLTRAGIDCSGLVHIAHRLSGVIVPRDACGWWCCSPTAGSARSSAGS